MKKLRVGFGALVVGCLVGLAGAREPSATGLVAVSAGEQVVVVSPANGTVRTFRTGPVGWLYPAPGGILFAPDLVDGKTTVIDLRRMRIARTLSAITMPHFDREVADRYLVVADDVLVVSYPDRAMLARVAAKIKHPWQVLISRDWATLIVLERLPTGSDPPVLWAVNLASREVIGRSVLPSTVTHMSFSPVLGLLALADTVAGVRITDPRTFAELRVLPVDGEVCDVAFAGEGDLLLAAARQGSRGRLARFRLKAKRGRLKVSKRSSTTLTSPPVRLVVSPDGIWAAVGLASATLQVLPAAHDRRGRKVTLPGVPRDIEFCDPDRRGPLLPEWSK